MRGLLVAVSGIDCSGKSTQIDLLARALRQQGKKPRVFWLRPGYSRELDTLRRIVRRIRPQTLPKVTADPGERARAFARPSVQRAWVNMAVVDLLVQYGLKIRTQLFAGRTIICDRYLLDALIDMRLRFPDVHSARQLELLQSFCPKPDLSILLMLSEQEMLRRMEIKREPFPDPPSVRSARYQEYVSLARTENLLVVDADRPIDTVHTDILDASLECRGVHANR